MNFILKLSYGDCRAKCMVLRTECVFLWCNNRFVFRAEGEATPNNLEKLAYLCPVSNRRVSLEGEIHAWSEVNPYPERVITVRHA